MYYTTNLPFVMSPLAWWIIIILALWSLIWKAFALWRSAQNGDKAWFIALFIVNTLGILDIFYIYVFSKRETPKPKSKDSSLV